MEKRGRKKSRAGKVDRMPPRCLPRLEVVQVNEPGEAMNREPIRRPKQVFQLVRNLLGRADREYFVVIPLDSCGRPLGLHVAHVGTLIDCEVHPREVFKVAILVNAAGVVLVHNHPSSTLKPSTDDTAMTERLSAAGNLLGIPVLDHVIVNEKSYVSLRQLLREWP